jgi:NAD(P)-dependent dehydrogenase (short-subunit alcohol dehydrogenase family)
MQLSGTVLIVGGTSGIGLATAKKLAAAGLKTYVTGRTQARADSAAKAIGGDCRGIALDVADTSLITDALAGLGPIDHVVLAAMERDGNHVRTYNPETASRALIIKLVGNVEVLHALGDRLSKNGSILIFGGAAFQRPTAGSVSTATMGAGVIGLVRSLATQLAPTRCNVIHPGIVGDSELATKWGAEKRQEVIDRTPIGRLITTDEVAEAGIALMSNPAINGASLVIDGGWLLT